MRTPNEACAQGLAVGAHKCRGASTRLPIGGVRHGALPAFVLRKGTNAKPRAAARTARFGEQCKPKPGRVMVRVLLLSAPDMAQFLGHT